MGCVRFGAPKELVLWLKETFGLSTFVETGTNKAETSVWAAKQFERVITVEAFEPLHSQAKESYGAIGNIDFILGDSRSMIRQLLPSLKEPAIIWLDAHWCGEDTFGKAAECPVLDELAAVNDSPLEHFVLIDDARLFVAPPPKPHDAEHWPGIREICEALAAHPSNRYIILFEDVIVAVPAWAKNQLIQYVRTKMYSSVNSSRDEGKPHVANGLKAKLRTLLGKKS